MIQIAAYSALATDETVTVTVVAGTGAAVGYWIETCAIDGVEYGDAMAIRLYDETPEQYVMRTANAIAAARVDR